MTEKMIYLFAQKDIYPGFEPWSFLLVTLHVWLAQQMPHAMWSLLVKGILPKRFYVVMLHSSPPVSHQSSQYPTNDYELMWEESEFEFDEFDQVLFTSRLEARVFNSPIDVKLTLRIRMMILIFNDHCYLPTSQIGVLLIYLTNSSHFP